MLNSIKNEWKIYLIFLPLLTWSLTLTILIPQATKAIQDEEKPSDFINYFTGANIVKNGNIGNLYNYQVQKQYQEKFFGQGLKDGILAFRTPPMTALIYAGLPLKDALGSFLITVVVNTALTIASIIIISKSYTQAVFAITAAPLTLPVLMSLYGGHINAVILLLFSLIYLMLKKDRPQIAGVLSAFLFLKPNFLLAILFFLLLNTSLRKALSYGIFFISTLAFLVFINSLLYGQGFLKDYIPFLFWSESTLGGTNLSNNTNLTGVIRPLTQSLEITYHTLFSFIPTVIMAAITLYVLYARRKFRFDHKFVYIALILPLVNLHTMYADLIIYVLAITLLLPVLLENKRNIFFYAVYMILMAVPWFSLIEMEWFITIVMLVLAFYLMKRYFDTHFKV